MPVRTARALEHLTFDQTMVRSLPSRPFASSRLGPVKVRRTLLLDRDPGLHPQLEIDAESSREQAADYIRYRFHRDHVRLERFLDPSGRYDFADMTALLNLVLRIAIPTAAPYHAALQNFRRGTGSVVHEINYDGGGTDHLRRLFTALTEALEPWERDVPGNPLITDLRTIFHEHM
jgi:hypothetical protein